MPSSRLGCPLSLKTPNMGNPGKGVLYLSMVLEVSLQTCDASAVAGRPVQLLDEICTDILLMKRET